ncbi:MAG TPA: GlxA family transcriptional regulator [Polyangiaceae bacterium]|jgi:transcriptional regulator GlxA family with amidase domain|nr:GlxA family transcriptional regulator [Polyangiaceae bacterium]
MSEPRSPKAPRGPRRVGIVVFDGMTALDAVGPAEAFTDAVAPRGGAAPYEVVTLGLSKRVCTSDSGFAIRPARTLADAPPCHTILVPGGQGLRKPHVMSVVAAWIAQSARRAERVASVCTGIYGIAPSGLLDGRRVTTHWKFAKDVAARFPKLRVHENELFIKDGRFYTSAGVTSGIDLALALIEEDLGPAASLAVARGLVVYVKRPGGQAQFSEPLRFQTANPDKYGELVAYVAAHLGEDLTVEALAQRMAVSPRQFSRQCRAALATTPAELVQRMRLDEAKTRLLEREATVSVVAESVGFRSADAFRRAFEGRFGIAPSDYRKRFGNTAVAKGLGA